jgi:uncharacterized Fe-S cluster protein YjdI
MSEAPATRKAYVGRGVTVTFDASICAHAANCVRTLPAVFDTRRRPWISPDGAPAEQVIATVSACPSGALRYSVTETG